MTKMGKHMSTFSLELQ